MASKLKDPKVPEFPNAVPADPTNTKPTESPTSEAPRPQEVPQEQDMMDTQSEQPPQEGPPEMGMDQMNQGMASPDDPENPRVELPDIIKKFEMKKIHSKLNSIDNFLYNNNNFSDEMIRVQKNVNTAIELFDFVVENLSIYRENLDKIIEIFNKFIDQIITLLNKYSQKIMADSKKEFKG